MMRDASKNRQSAAALRHREKMRGATKEGKAEAAAAKKQAKQDKKDREAAMHAEEEAKRAKKERIAAKRGQRQHERGRNGEHDLLVPQSAASA